MVLRHMVRRAAAESAVVVATDTALRPAITTNLRVAQQRIVEVPNVVDRAGRPRSARSAAARAAELRVVTVGRLVHNKGYDLLAQALTGPHPVAAAVRWQHFGSGPAAQELVAAARASTVRFTITEDADDARVRDALADADLFVQPSRYEGSSLTTLEAMADGVLVLATPVGGIPDKIEHLRTGLRAADVDAAAIADGLALAVALPAPQVDAITDAASALVAQRFAPQSAAAAYADLYDSLTTDSVARLP